MAMQDFKFELPFSFGTPRVQLNLSGMYAKLPRQSDDNLRVATVTSLIQLPLWLQTMGQDDSGKTQRQEGNRGSEPVSCKIESPNGTIGVQLDIKSPQQQIPDELITMVTNAIAASVQNHADAAILGTPATNDALVGVKHYLASPSLDQTTQQSLVGASGSHSQR